MSAPTPELDTRFSEPDATAPTWSAVEEVLRKNAIFFLSTVRADGRPHVTPLPAIWLDGALHISPGLGEQKTENLHRNPDVVLATGTPALSGGLDVVVEGRAERVTDPSRLQQLVALWKSELDWDYDLEGDLVGDGAGHHAEIHAVHPTKVLAFGKGPYTQTRYRF